MLPGRRQFVRRAALHDAPQRVKFEVNNQAVKEMKRPIGKRIKSILRQTPLRRLVMAYRHLGLRSTDVFLASYPRSGNTWLKSLISSALFGEALTNFSDKENEEMPIVGFHGQARSLLKNGGRIIKTHEVYRPEYRKAIWILRDPRDVVVSQYRLAIRYQEFVGTLNEYTERFVVRLPTPAANWQQHTQSWITSPIAGTPNLLSLRFEDLREEPGRYLREILGFLGVTCTEERIEAALRQNSVESMAARHAAYDQKAQVDPNIAAVPAINSGASGAWRDALSSESQRLIHEAFGGLMREMRYSTEV